jgi:rhamnogalacturonan acetylesterase
MKTMTNSVTAGHQRAAGILPAGLPQRAPGHKIIRTSVGKISAARCVNYLAAFIFLVFATQTIFAQTNIERLAVHSHALAMPQNPQLPSLFLIGDSTVRNGQGKGDGGQWGWGDFLAPYFDKNKLNVVNRALGGTSSRTFYRDQWPAVRALLKPGDFVILQFGHNDSSAINDASRARGTIKGVGDEAQTITNQLTKKIETVHSFGWYEKQLVTETREKGATPMICSLIPRNTWKNGRAARNKNDYAGWAGQTAQSENVPFLDINEIIARRYDQLGQEKVKPLFIVGAGPHTSMDGAKLNASCVIAALKSVTANSLAPYFLDKANDVTPADLSQPAPPPATVAPDKTEPE